MFVSISHTHIWYEVGIIRLWSSFMSSTDQPGMVANLARGQLNRENGIFLSLFAPDN